MATVCSAHKFQQQLPKSINTHTVKLGQQQHRECNGKMEKKELLQKAREKRDRKSATQGKGRTGREAQLDVAAAAATLI